ncbi:MAG TPA: ABC transporter ATP-binding protein [Roseimicrobium sp.]|nr:ABC transporter ATP-binding protein [Roseimicrobium sp.]
MPHLVIDALQKSFTQAKGRSVPALTGATLSVERGKLLSVVGPSGCGKTTLLRLTAGFETPDTGSITLAGRPLAGVDPADRKMAMVFQQPALYPHMTVRENLSSGLRWRHVPRAEVERRVAEMSRLLGVESLMDRLPEMLSGGEQQRVALGRAFIQEPEVVLLDEPLSSLDAPLRREMRSFIRQLQQRLGTTMVFVTHDQEEALSMGDRVAVMREGRVEQVGSPREVYRQPASLFVARFIGVPSVNTITGTLRRTNGGMSLDTAGGPVSLPQAAVENGLQEGREVVMAVRPEDFFAADTTTPGAWRVVVEQVETPGSDSLVHIQCAGQNLLWRTMEEFNSTSSTELFFMPRWDRVRWFDSKTGEAITR